MGILNVTPDSFSDGGKYFSKSNAIKHAELLLSQGADVIDVGGQSTRPGAEEVGEEEEIRRIIPVISSIRKTFPKCILSVDTFLSSVAQNAIASGANWINDISGGKRDSDMFKVVSECKCPFVLTHSRGNSKTMHTLTKYNNVAKEVHESLNRNTDKALSYGVSEDKIIWDPGVGFAKSNYQNLDLIRNLDEICNDRFPVLVGPSRKRFIGSVLDQSEPIDRIWGTASVVSRCVQLRVDIVRVHDIYEMNQVIKMYEAII